MNLDAPRSSLGMPPGSNRLPPSGDAIERLTVIQVFLGGFLLFATAVGLMIGRGTGYDGMLSAIGWQFGAAWIAGLTLVVALVIGLPLRSYPRSGRDGSRTAR